MPARRSKIEQKIENPTITLDTYAKSDECCLLHCITPEGTLIWFPKKVSEMKPCELMIISKKRKYRERRCKQYIAWLPTWRMLRNEIYFWEKTNAHEPITPKVSYPMPQRGWIGVPKWVHEGTLIRKLPGGGKKMQQTTKWQNKMVISEITAQGTKC